jgi:4-hydroxy-tetrahydrodipicolinate reductase
VIKVAVFGAAGRMGRQVCDAVEAAEGLKVVARIDVGQDPKLAVAAGAEVAVDFTNPEATLGNIEFCVANGINVVVGTSGFGPDRVARVEELLAAPDSRAVGILIAPNFSLGAVLMMKFAAQASAFFESVEIIELHHPNKLDAPSGTALRTAQLIAEAREAAGVGPSPDATAEDGDHHRQRARNEYRGGKVDDVTIHSVRLRGLIAHQEVLLGGVGETLTIRHDSLDRASFMPGVLLGVREVAEHPGLTIGLEHYLSL